MNEPTPIMYAIAFDLNTDALEKHYKGAAWQNAYGDLKKSLEKKNFKQTQGSLYYGETTGTKKITMVLAVLAAVQLSQEFPWFKKCVRDIRVLQILDYDDLMPAVRVGNPD